MDYILHFNEKPIEHLLSDIPKEIRLGKDLNLPLGLSELELINFIKTFKNNNDYTKFLGAGIYSHFIPALVDSLANRSEFVTAYTPYQAELSQGLLQSIFEYQTAIAHLTGMEVCNASLYDGATSLFEAVKLVSNATGRKKILVSHLMHPEYLESLSISIKNFGIEVFYFNSKVDIERLLFQYSEEIAGICISNPNFYGEVEDLKYFSEMAHKVGALSVVSIYPISLGVLAKPGDLGVDVVIGEGQSLGMPVSLGGATLGLFATKKKFVRLMPGRVVGRTTDKAGNIGYVLTMQTREQHIRREKAYSNICSNHAHYALRALIYLACMGDNGLKIVARRCMDNAYYLAGKLGQIDYFELPKQSGFFNEFVIKLQSGLNFLEFDEYLRENGIVLGLKIENNSWLVAVTEVSTKAEIDRVIDVINKYFRSL